MAVQFIFGRSGTGKTNWCIDQVAQALAADSDQPLILLVPEQATYQAERAILARENMAGYNRLKVLSFDRLQFLLLGKNTARPALSQIGRQMIIHRLLRAGADKLTMFASSANRPGLSVKMAETISELQSYANDPEDLDELLEQLTADQADPLAAMKFSDITLIFKAYVEHIEGKFIDPDVQLTRACRAVAGADFIKGAKLWVDGFAGFTESELALLAQLLNTVTDSHIALCLDASRINLKKPDIASLEPLSIFSPTEQTYARLFEIAKKSRLKTAEPIILTDPMRFTQSPSLAHIENSIFTANAAKTSTDDTVRIVAAPNARAEVQFVTTQILQLIKQKGCRYRDIAVIASDIDSYQHYITAHFEDSKIPFFIDRRKPLSQHPVVHLIGSALQAVTGGFARRDVFSFLKNDLVPTSRNDIDTLENYCIAFGISGRDWQSENDWHFAGDDNSSSDEQLVNQIRRREIAPLLALHDSLYEEKTARQINAVEFTKSIFDLLDRLQVRRTLAEWLAKAIEANDPASADEHRQFYDRLISIFDELTEIFADQTMTCEDYKAILDSAFSQLKLAFIPPKLDQVLVGSIERSRHPDLKAAFLIGAVQKHFPSPVTTSGILTDDDRLAAENADFKLAASSRQKLVERQYLAYIAFTRPSEHLCISYPLADEKGAPQLRSQFITNLESLFDDLHEERSADHCTPIEHAASESELMDLLCTNLGSDATPNADRNKLNALLQTITTDDHLHPIASRVNTALEYDNRASLDTAVTRSLFAKHFSSSATRLTTFAACPYKHFARYVLSLEQRKEFKLEPLDLGSFYHEILDRLLKTLNARKLSFSTIDDEKLIAILKEQIEEFAKTDAFISNFTRHSPHNAFIVTSAADVLTDCVRAIARAVRAGSFIPAKSEAAFGHIRDVAEKLGEYKIQLSHDRTLSLNGKIDRLDIAEIDNRKVAVVFDYKRTAITFGWARFFHGLDMQLPIYILATRAATKGKTDCIGAFYFPIEVKPKTTTLTKLPSRSQAFDYKARGVFNGDYARQLDAQASKDSQFYNFYVKSDGAPYGSYKNRGALRAADFDDILKFAETGIAELAEAILSGQIEVNPFRLKDRSPCPWCEYKSLCRFDWQINEYNHLENLNKEQVLANIRSADG